MELLLGHEKIITKSGISLNAGTLNRSFTVVAFHDFATVPKKGFMKISAWVNTS
jgi:hypothetical protein